MTEDFPEEATHWVDDPETGGAVAVVPDDPWKLVADLQSDLAAANERADAAEGALEFARKHDETIDAVLMIRDVINALGVEYGDDAVAEVERLLGERDKYKGHCDEFIFIEGEAGPQAITRLTKERDALQARIDGAVAVPAEHEPLWQIGSVDKLIGIIGDILSELRGKS
jgi:hypothetical protein